MQAPDRSCAVLRFLSSPGRGVHICLARKARQRRGRNAGRRRCGTDRGLLRAPHPSARSAQRGQVDGQDPTGATRSHHRPSPQPDTPRPGTLDLHQHADSQRRPLKMRSGKTAADARSAGQCHPGYPGRPRTGDAPSTSVRHTEKRAEVTRRCRLSRLDGLMVNAIARDPAT